MSKTVTHSASVGMADLKKAINFARMPMERRNLVPIISTMRLAFLDGKMTATGTDLDVEHQYMIEAEAKGNFGVCVSPACLAGIVFAGDGDRVHFEVDYTTSLSKRRNGTEFESTDIIARVRAGDFEGAFRAILPPDYFPIFEDKRLEGPDGAPSAVVEISERDLHRMLHDTIPAISTEETRYYLNGVYFHSKEEGVLIAVATDGRRLAKRTSANSYPAELSGIIPAKAAKMLHRVLSPGGNATLRLCGNSLMHRVTSDADDWRITYKLIDGTFPDYTRVIPTAGATWSVPLSLGMLSRPMAFMPTKFGDARHLKFDLDAKKMVASSHDDFDVSFPIVGAEGSGKVGFNAFYLRDILRRHSPVVISSSSAGDPAIVKTEDPDLLNVIMPVRV